MLFLGDISGRPKRYDLIIILATYNDRAFSINLQDIFIEVQITFKYLLLVLLLYLFTKLSFKAMWTAVIY